MHLNKNKRKGLAVLAGLSALAVVAGTLVFFMQTITAEKRFDAATFRIQQAEQLAEDLFRIAKKQKKDTSLTIPASEFHGIADLQLTVTIKDAQISAKVEYAGNDLPESMRYSAERNNAE